MLVDLIQHTKFSALCCVKRVPATPPLTFKNLGAARAAAASLRASSLLGYNTYTDVSVGLLYGFYIM